MNDYEKLERAKQLITEVQSNLSVPPSTELPIPLEELRIGYKPSNWILWKPKSDSDGRVVLLLPGSWPIPGKVEVLRDDGEWERLKFDGIANGDRYHYRGSLEGAGYKGKNHEGEIRVYWGDALGVIEFIDKPRNRQGN